MGRWIRRSCHVDLSDRDASADTDHSNVRRGTFGCTRATSPTRATHAARPSRRQTNSSCTFGCTRATSPTRVTHAAGPLPVHPVSRNTSASISKRVHTEWKSRTDFIEQLHVTIRFQVAEVPQVTTTLPRSFAARGDEHRNQGFSLASQAHCSANTDLHTPYTLTITADSTFWSSRLLFSPPTAHAVDHRITRMHVFAQRCGLGRFGRECSGPQPDGRSIASQPSRTPPPSSD